MGFRLLLQICALLYFSGHAFAEDPGTEFAFVFMQNLLPNVTVRLEVLLAAIFPDTQATIQLPNKNFSTVVPLRQDFPLIVELPDDTDILNSTTSNTVRITSNKPITVMAIDGNSYKTSVTVISPIANWGLDYYVVMPDIEADGSLGQVAIVNGPQPNFVSILLRGMVEFEHAVYLAGEHINLTLNPWEAVQLKANESLSGSHVLSQEPVALFSGRTCVEMHGKCQTCLQLPPVSAWGHTFVAAPLPYSKVSSKLYILAAAEIEVNLVHGSNVVNLTMTAGVVKELDFDPMTELLISSHGKLLVLLYFGGGILGPAEGFLFNLAPREKACFSYAIISVPRFKTYLLVVTEGGSQDLLQLNCHSMPQSHWKDIHGTDLVYTTMPLHAKAHYSIISNPACVFGVATVEIAEMTAFGTIGVCLDKVHPCPPNSHYSMCASGCPATCGVDFPLSCPLSCQEGCECNSGYISNGDGCIPIKECGCYVTSGQFLKEGNIIYEDDCQVACTCQGGQVVCSNHACSANERCRTVEGVTACYPEQIVCWVSDQKYHTFDGVSFHTHGDCLYTMVTTKCSANDTDDLNIEFQLKSLSIQSIRLKIYGHTIVQEHNHVKVDGTAYPFDGITHSLPFDLKLESHFPRNYSGNHALLQIEADLGLILMASPSMVWINLTSHYSGKICGLCGNANGNASDDIEDQTLEDFLSSWISPNGSLCQSSSESYNDEFPFNLTSSKEDLYNLTISGELYNLTSSKELYNLTSSKGDLSNLTTSRELYNLTSNTGDLYNLTIIEEIYNLTIIEEIYNLTSIEDPYSDYPYNLTSSEDLHNLTSSEGPYSVNPYNLTSSKDPYNLMSSERDQYNLTSNGGYPYNLVESCDVIVMAEGVFSNCHALIDPSWFFNTCLDYASVDLMQGVCLAIKDYVSECQEIGATVHQWKNRTVCGSHGNSVSQEEHQTVHPTHPTTQTSSQTFRKLHVVGSRNDSNYIDCMYQNSFQHVLPESSLEDPLYCILPLAFVHNTTDLERFSIRLEFRIESTCTSLLIMEVYGKQIVVLSGIDEILVNGFPTSLPVSLASDKIQMWFKFPNLILTTDFGLQVIFSVGGEVFVLAPAPYKDHLYGYCSNQRSAILSAEQYLCIKLTSQSCGIENISRNGCHLLLEEDGPFQACQEVFEPQLYYHECQKRFCEGDGNQRRVCEALQEYTRICEAQSAIIKPWRNDTFCQDV